jgi:4-amino-4-deoxy-L-arabinose transferase-like glycosyltransferase
MKARERVRAFLPPDSALTLLMACLALYLYPTLVLPLTRGEAFYAQIPREMLAAGHWLLATFNGVPHLDKPPGLYWLNLLAFKLFGVSDRVARVPTLGLAVLEVWLAFRVGRLLLSPRAAWLGSLVLCTSIGFFYLHLELFSDHLISVALMAALYALLRWLQEPRPVWACLFHGAMAAGYLSKGLIGVGFPVMIAALYGILGRQPRLWRLIVNPAGLALLLLLVVPWLVAMEHLMPGFLWHHFVREHLIRFLGQRQPGGVSTISPFLLWLFLFIWLMPWAVLLPEALYRLGKNLLTGQAPRQTVLLIIWPALVMAVFTFSSTRIEYYSLPALPPLALILGWRLDRYLQVPRDLSVPLALLALGLIGLGTSFLVQRLDGVLAGNRRELVGVFPLVLPLARQVSFILPPLALAGALLGRFTRLGVWAYGALALVLLFFTFQALVALAPVRSDKLFGEYVHRRAQPGDLVVMEFIEEFELGGSFSFYARRPFLMVQRRGLPRFLHPVPPEENYLISPERLQEVWTGPRRVFLLVDDVVPLEPFLREGRVALVAGGKRLLVNRQGEEEVSVSDFQSSILGEKPR